MAINMRGPQLLMTSAYSPHAGMPGNERRQFYTALDRLHTQHGKAKCYFIAGDFNARIHARMDGEEYILGPHIFGRGRQYLE